jgi:hypothetical protein
MKFATTVRVLKRGVDCTVLFTCALEEVREILVVSVLIDRSTTVLALIGMVHGSVDGRWRGGLNNELPRDGNAMRRAVGAHDTTALSAVMFSIPKGELSAADWTVGYLRIRLPRRKNDFAGATSSSVETGLGRI